MTPWIFVELVVVVVVVLSSGLSEITANWMPIPIYFHSSIANGDLGIEKSLPDRRPDHQLSTRSAKYTITKLLYFYLFENELTRDFPRSSI